MVRSKRYALKDGAPFGLNSWGRKESEQIITTQKSEHVSYRHVTMQLPNTRTVRSVLSELKMSLRNVLAWYPKLVRLVHTFKQHANVPYSYFLKKCVPYKRNVLFSKIEACRSVLTYRTVLPSLLRSWQHPPLLTQR